MSISRGPGGRLGWRSPATRRRTVPRRPIDVQDAEADLLTRGAPYRFSLWVAAVDAAAAQSGLLVRPGEIVEWLRTDEPGERVRFDLTSVGSPGGGGNSARRQLDAWSSDGVRALGHRRVDVLTDVSDSWLDRQLTPRGGEAVAADQVRRLDSLAGPRTLEQLLARAGDPDRPDAVRAAAAGAVRSPIVNSLAVPGLWARTLDAALALTRTGADGPLAARLVAAVGAGARLAALVGGEAPTEYRLVELAGRPSIDVRRAVLDLLSRVPGVRGPEAVALLVRLAADPSRDEVAPDRLALALGGCPGSPEVIDALERLRGHRDHDVRRAVEVAVARVVARVPAHDAAAGQGSEGGA